MITTSTKTIIAKVVEIIAAIQTGSNNSFGQVLSYPTNEFNSDPAVTVYLDVIEPDSQQATNAQSIRNWNFNIDIYVLTQGRTETEAYNLARDLTDQVLDAIDTSERLGGLVQYVRASAMAEQAPLTIGNSTNIVSSVRLSCYNLTAKR